MMGQGQPMGQQFQQMPMQMQQMPMQPMGMQMQPMGGCGCRPQPMGRLGYQTPKIRGVLNEWNDQKACGFIQTKDGMRFFGHKSAFVEQFLDGCGPPIGTPLLFTLGTDPKSFKQRAECIEVETMQNTASARGQRLQGTLLDWNPSKACGFIKCPDAGKKFFAHKNEFSFQWADGDEPALGTHLSFVPGIDLKSGREHAEDIQLGLMESRTFGTLVEFQDDRGCGFIECTEPAGKRYFAHKMEFAEQFHDLCAPVGAEVSFIPGIDNKSGRERATDIRLHLRGTSTQHGAHGGTSSYEPDMKRQRTSW